MRHAVLALAPSILLATAAHAAGPKVYVAPFGIVGPEVPADLSAQTATLLSDELKNHKSLEVLKGPSLIGSAAPTADSGAAQKQKKGLDRAGALVKQGDATMLKLNFSGAAAKYRAAVKLYLQNLPGLESFDQINYARLSMATALFRAGEESKGEAALADVIRLDPERTLDPAGYPPVFIRTYQKIQKELLRKTRGAVSVVSQPAGAEVHLDGKKVGVTPILIKDLIRGPHHVKLVSGSDAPWTAKVDITPTKVANLDADLGGKVQGPVGAVVASLARGKLDKGTLKKIEAVAGPLGATHVVFGALNRATDAYTVKSYLYEVKSKKVGALKEMSFDLDMLGAAIEVFQIAKVIEKGTQTLPEALSLPAKIFEAKVIEEPVLAEVSAAPAEAPVAAIAPTEPRRPIGPVAPARGPVAPARGPVMPAAPVKPRDETPPPRRRQRDSLAVGPVQPASGTSGPGAPITPVGLTGEPLTPGGPIAPSEGRTREPDRSRQVTSLTERQRLSAEDLESGPRYSAVDIGEIVIPKDEVKQKKGWPWWAWTLTGVVAAGALGAGGYYAVDQGLFVGAADNAAVTFSW